MGKWTRRAFIASGTLAGGGLLVGVGVGVAIRPGHRTPDLAKLVENTDEVLVNAWVKILPDNSIKVIVPHAEMGQGVHTALPMMLADEMDADWSTVSMEQAPAHQEYANFHLARHVVLPGKVPGMVEDTLTGVFLKITQSMSMQSTGGSYSVRSTGQLGMRTAGAAAREMLVSAAAQTWAVPATEIRTENSYLHHDSSERSEPFAAFAKIAAAGKGPEQPTLKTSDQYKIMGQSVRRLDIPAKVDGSAIFGTDIDLPGMKYAAVKAAPVFGSSVVTIDSAAAETMKGVIKIVNLDTGVGVIADSYWHAKKALDRVLITYTKSDADKLSSDSMFEQFRQDMDAAVTNGKEEEDFSKGDARGILAQSDNVLEAEYRVPFLAHATMEPMNCTAWVHDGQIDLWAGLQNPLGTRDFIADKFGYETDKVNIHNVYLGGGFGRRSLPDFSQQGVQLAAALPGIPIKMMWSREEDVRRDHYRQAVMSRFKAALDTSGMPIAWENQFVDKHEPVEAPYIPYAIDNQFIHFTRSPTHVPFGAWRSVDHSQHAFFTESFIDELAVAAGKDPYHYRRTLLAGEPRMCKVLETAAKMADWGKAMPTGWGQGIAVHRCFNTIVAQVVDLDMSSGTPRVDKVFCAADAGFVISPDGFIAQMESGIVFGLTAVLYGEITLKDGAVTESNFNNYKMVRMHNSPAIEVEIINSGESLGGAGEPGTPPIAPAVTNAIFAVTRKRIRDLPVSKHDGTYKIS
tara:strand:- start:1202 stop:3427 length:2226 start_codon:yes stop_codon:yes gene_type:complete